MITAATRRAASGLASPGLWLLTLLAVGTITPWAAARAGVNFVNCVTGSDGSITCDTTPTGNTYLNDKDAQYGLLQQASPGWSEFSPYEGYNEDFGDDEF